MSTCQPIYQSARLFAIFLSLLVVVGSPAVANQSSLSIYPDDKTHTNVQQLVFEFDRPVTHVGGVPTFEQLQQLSVVKGDGKSAKKWQPVCKWRYVDTSRLVCELVKPLFPGSIYHLAVNKGFGGLNGWQLENSVKHTIKTPYPQGLFSNEINQLNDYYRWPVIYLNSQMSLKKDVWLRDFLTSPMLVRGPDNHIKRIDVGIVEERTYAPLNIDKLDFDFSNDGRYELFIPKGTQFDFSDYANPVDIVLYHREFYQDFKLLGIRCYQSEEDFLANKISSWHLDKLTDCLPNQIDVALSRPVLDPYKHFRRLLDDDFTSMESFRQSNGRYVYSLIVNENKDYQWDLSNLTGTKSEIFVSDKTDSKAHVSFSTVAAPKSWSFDHLDVITPFDYEKKVLYATNVKAIPGKVGVIDSKDKLQAWLTKQDIVAEQYTWPIEYRQNNPDDYFWKKGMAQKFDFKQFLPVNGGLLVLDFSKEKRDLKANEHLYNYRQSQSTILDVKGFNLQLLQAHDALIQATSWQTGEPISGVNIHLVCEDEDLSGYLGDTNEQGILHLAAAIDGDNCWLWSEHSSCVTAVNLSGASKARRKAAITGWSAQPVYEPGKTVDFGLFGKKRSDNGLKAIDALDGRQLYFGRQFSAQSTDLPINLPQFSTYGFASVAIETGDNWPVGEYYLKLYSKDNPEHMDILGSVELEYYQTPEYEVKFKGTKRMALGDSFDWALDAKRLNGVPLADAKVMVEYGVDRFHSPPFWPQKYKWLTDDLHGSPQFNFPVFTGKLDENGVIKASTEKIHHQSGFFNINATATVTAKDGEVQTHQTNGFYFASEYYFGVKVNTKAQTIKLVAIDRNGHFLKGKELKGEELKGKELDGTAAVLPDELQQAINKRGIVVNIAPNDELRDGQSFNCRLDSLYESCDLKGRKGSINVTIIIDQQIIAKGSVFVSQYYARQSSSPLEFSQQTLNVSANQSQALLTLNAKYAGKALITVATDKIESSFYVNIKVGSNEVAIPIERRYMPQMSVMALMTLSNKVLADKALANDTNTRMYSASAQVGIREPQKLALDVKVPQGELLSGAAVDVAIGANLPAGSQTWLVNEGLWQLLSLDEQSYDLAKLLELDGVVRYSNLWRAINLHVVNIHRGETFSLSAPASFHEADVSGQKMGYLSKSNPEMISVSGASIEQNSNAKFVDSMWFNLMSHVETSKPQSLQFNLPKVPGRYKLVTVAANDDQFDLDVQTITTYLPQEYFVDAPKQMVQSDKAELLLTVINRTDNPLDETLKLTIDGKPWRELEVKGKANAQQLVSVALPRLDAGNHMGEQKVIGVWHDEFGQVGERVIKVKADTVKVKQQFVVSLGGESGAGGNKITLPDNYIKGSLSFFGRALNELAPSWESHLSTVRHYPYQCFEQNISRAVSYAYSPIAAKVWPYGKTEFEKLLAGSGKYLNNGGFSYFPNFFRDDFLTAYSHLVSHWLDGNQLRLQAKALANSDRVKEILSNDGNIENRSMALLALTKTGELTRTQVLEYRSQIGASSGFSQVLQLLALRHVNANADLIETTIKDILRRGYQDSGVNILSNNAERCFAYMAFGDKHPRAEKLLEQVLAEQWQKADFGNTFASAVCSVAFKDKPTQSAELKSLDYRSSGNLAQIESSAQSRQQVVMEYSQAIDNQPDFSHGIDIKQQYFIATNTDNWHELKNVKDKWRLMPDGHTLQIGDLVRVVVSVDSPIKREHVVIDSPIAGAFEADNAKFEHSVSNDAPIGPAGSLGAGRMRMPDMHRIMPRVEQQIEIDRVLFFPYWLDAGQTEFSYLLKVRNGGKFIAPSAKVELMYQPDVAAQTKGRYFEVEGY